MESRVLRPQVGYDVNTMVADGATFTVSGSCMDSAESPLRLKDGQRLLVRRFEGCFNPYSDDIEKVRGKVCVVQYTKWGYRYFAAKEVLGVDEISGALRLACYYPEYRVFSLKVSAIEQIYYVDGVLVPEG